MKAHIFITFKNGVLDPEAKATQNALHNLGFNSIQHVEMSKKITLTFSHNDANLAKTEATQMANDLLANTVIQDFNIIIED